MYCLLDCPKALLIGNGFCDQQTNIAECNFDGGDCCNVINSNNTVGDGFCNDINNSEFCNYDGGDCCGYDIKMDLCSECKCKHKETCSAGVYHSLVGDGFCNDETNNADCQFDGGDCCGACVVKDHCSECACLDGANGMNVLIGNKFCNDETNNAECFYDGGDCCGYELNYDHCSECTCFHQQMCASGFNGRVIVFLSYVQA